MIAYEVTVEVRPDLAAAYVDFMQRRHLPEILATGCFHSMEFHQAGPGLFRQRFVAEDQQALDRYLADHAPVLRTDYQKHFPEGTALSRAVWRELGRWDAPSRSRVHPGGEHP